MTEQDDKALGIKVLGIASGVRKVVLLGHKQIREAVDESRLKGTGELTDFADMLMQGYEKQYIIDRLRISEEMVEKFDEIGLEW